MDHHVGITASVDTFFRGIWEHVLASANPHLLRALQGMIERVSPS